MKAAIDIGTNTVLLLIAEVEGKEIITMHEEQRIPRLGRGVDEDRVINEQAVNRLLQALEDYKVLLNEQYPEVNEVIVTATSAVRDAQNRDDILRQVKKKTGFEVRLLSGKEEAEWTLIGALSVLSESYRDEAVILDIGGGSTEIAYSRKNELLDSHSFDMGSVRFTERFLKHDPPLPDEINRCRRELENFYASKPFHFTDSVKAVGVAGTCTTLAAVLSGMKSYSAEKINGYVIELPALMNFIENYSKQPHTVMLKQNPQLLEGRSDIFLAGLLILKGFMKFYHFNSITVSTGGIRHGAIIRQTD